MEVEIPFFFFFYKLQLNKLEQRDFNDMSHLWQMQIHLKLVSFAWIALQDSNPIMDHLHSKEMVIMNGCIISLNNEETINSESLRL